MLSLSAIVLAAGQGKRMKSPLPKVLHQLAGRPLVYYPVRAALESGASEVVVVVGHEGDQVRGFLAQAFGTRVVIAHQAEQRGTGHAALMAMGAVRSTADATLILYGDTPLLEVSDLRALWAVLEGHPKRHSPCSPARWTIPRAMAVSFGTRRGAFRSIREHRDLCNDKERAITEVNPGVYAARLSFLREALQGLRPDNAQKELYLTDVVEAAGRAGGAIALPTDVGECGRHQRSGAAIRCRKPRCTAVSWRASAGRG